MSVLTDIKNRGVSDTVFLVCDPLKGLPEVVGNVWPRTTVQTCIIDLIRNTFRLASKKDWDALNKDVRLIYTAPNADAARVALEELTQKWGRQYGVIIWLWENAWEEFTPFLAYDVEIRTVICSTNSPTVGRQQKRTNQKCWKHRKRYRPSAPRLPTGLRAPPPYPLNGA